MAAAVDLFERLCSHRHEFLVAVTKDGAFPSLGGMETPETAEDLLRVWNSAARNGEFERGALAAYHMLSVSRGSRSGAIRSGRRFETQEENELALEHFFRAGKDQSKLAPEVQAELNEAIGILHPTVAMPCPISGRPEACMKRRAKAAMRGVVNVLWP